MEAIVRTLCREKVFVKEEEGKDKRAALESAGENVARPCSVLPYFFHFFFAWVQDPLACARGLLPRPVLLSGSSPSCVLHQAVLRDTTNFLCPV